MKSFPWPSLLTLLYPLAAMGYYSQFPATKTAVIGYGVTNLAYLLFAAGVVGSFGIFGLTKRWQIFTAGAICFVLGVVLSNID